MTINNVDYLLNHGKDVDLIADYLVSEKSQDSE